jgi:intracellular multiplication protein IcmJ
MKEIKLSVKRSMFRSDDPEKDMADSEFKKIRPDVLKRDNHECQFCGFRAEKYQEVHHLDDDHSNNSMENLVTTCALCHANHHLGFSGIKNRGTLIYLNPDWGMSQAAINNITRLLWVSEDSDNAEVDLLCSDVMARLERCAFDAKKVLGTNEISILADYYLKMDNVKYQKRMDVMKGVYVLPRKDGFSEIVTYWKTLKGLNLKSAEKTAEQRLRQWSDSDGTILDLCKKLNIEMY